MRAITQKITLAQRINNYANTKQNFTQFLTDCHPRYIVGIKNLYSGTNPSTDYELIKKISDAINTFRYNSIGGWFDKNTNIYYLDANIHLHDINTALRLAKEFNQLAIYDKETNKVIYLKDYRK